MSARALIPATAAVLVAGLVGGIVFALAADDSKRKLSVGWQKNYLTISGDHLPAGKPVRIHYLEAYCRPGSTEREWGETVIGHTTEPVSKSDDGSQLKLKCTLKDGVTVDHEIRAGADVVEFELTAHNPTGKTSHAHWAQPCIRVGDFTGATGEDAYEYIKKCFVFTRSADKPDFLPTTPWATRARYLPGQVWCPSDVDRDDVNPRPLNPLAPKLGLIGCVSADEKQILAIAWEPYQELFQGVIRCIHSDFRVGGLKPGETKKIRGRLYIVPNDMAALLERYREDFPE